MQSKRIQLSTETGSTAGSSTRVLLEVPTEPREKINFHNIWIGLGVVPVNADANANGQWVLYTLPDPVTATILTEAVLNTEVHNARIVACGLWYASNEMPFNLPPIQVKTSRNLNAGDKLILESVIEAITAGTVTQTLSLCAHSVRQ